MRAKEICRTKDIVIPTFNPLGHSYRLADEALYLAKRQGKNRYVIV